MTSEESSTVYEYRDAELCMRMPSYLRPKKGMRFFAPRSKKEKHQPLLNITVELPNEDLTEALWSTIINASSSDWMGVQYCIVRRGKAAYLTDGLELLTSSRNVPNGDVHNYHVLFLAGPYRVYVTFLGKGDFDSFDSLCRELVSSIRIHDKAGAPTGPQ